MCVHRIKILIHKVSPKINYKKNLLVIQKRNIKIPYAVMKINLISWGKIETTCLQISFMQDVITGHSSQNCVT